jgi:hypothetical protein
MVIEAFAASTTHRAGWVYAARHLWANLLPFRIGNRERVPEGPVAATNGTA